VPVLWVLGSSVKDEDSNPTVPPRHHPGSRLFRPVLDTSLFKEPTRLPAFATTLYEDMGYLLENRLHLFNAL
jgi:hypothetical protein